MADRGVVDDRRVLPRGATPRPVSKRPLSTADVAPPPTSLPKATHRRGTHAAQAATNAFRSLRAMLAPYTDHDSLRSFSPATNPFLRYRSIPDSGGETPRRTIYPRRRRGGPAEGLAAKAETISAIRCTTSPGSPPSSCRSLPTWGNVSPPVVLPMGRPD